MANEETKYFNVKNTSVRLVHIGGVVILPEEVVAVVDDPKGINRKTVEVDEYLEETDEDATASGRVGVPLEKKEAAKPKAKSAKAASASSESEKTTPTGAGWNANKQ